MVVALVVVKLVAAAVIFLVGLAAGRRVVVHHLNNEPRFVDVEIPTAVCVNCSQQLREPVTPLTLFVEMWDVHGHMLQQCRIADDNGRLIDDDIYWQSLMSSFRQYARLKTANDRRALNLDHGASDV